MARKFLRANIDRIDLVTPALAWDTDGQQNGIKTPISAAIWAYDTSGFTGGVFYVPFMISQPLGYNFNLLILNNTVRGQCAGGNTNGSISLSSGRWYHFAYTVGVSSASTVPDGATAVYVNGAVDATAANGLVDFLLGFNTISTRIGGDNVNTGRGWDGYIADFAIWNALLTSSEILALSRGARPGTIRPGNLKLWPDLDGASLPVRDLSGFGAVGSATGTSKIAGPPLVPIRRVQTLAAAAATSAVFTGVGQTIFRLRPRGWAW